jgi:disulfide oxidoreductase YuzD
MLESIDLSFNNFTADGLIKYIEKIVDQNYMYHLRTINIAGNSLRVKDEEHMQNVLCSMI